jgi:uncharacterized protein (TIGR02594 family)
LTGPALSVPKPQKADQRAHGTRSTQKNLAQKNLVQKHAAQKKNKIAPRAAVANVVRVAAAPMPAGESQRPLLGWPALVSEARKYMGTNPTARSRLWCATFMNMVLAKVGYSGTNSDAAKSFAQYGRRISEPQIGAIAVLTRGKNGGHVGVVSGIDNHGNPVIISGNHNKRVGEATYARSRVIAYVMPTGRGPATVQTASARSSEPAFESPIAELIAAIEAEQNRTERPVNAAAQPSDTRRAAQPQLGPRSLPLDPALANLLGVSEAARARAHAPQAAPQAMPQRAVAAPVAAAQRPVAPPIRERQIQQVQQPGRVASGMSAGTFGFR